MLFAVVIPLAPLMGLLFNVFEIYSDKFKLINKLYLRSIP